jgi:hypothetical protein
MRNRWLIYGLIGLAFGLADWFFLDLLASLGQNQVLNENLLQAPEFLRILITFVLVGLNYGVWLAPVIPIAIYEVKRSQSLRRAALSAVLVWSAAMVSYYAYYTFALLFIGLPNLDFMLFSNRNSATYWADSLPLFQRVILDQFIEWIGIAVIGGIFVGLLSAYGFKIVSGRRATIGSGRSSPQTKGSIQ